MYVDLWVIAHALYVYCVLTLHHPLPPDVFDRRQLHSAAAHTSNDPSQQELYHARKCANF
jgi:hypothetical protein